MTVGKDWTCEIGDLARSTAGQILSTVSPVFSRVGSDTRSDLTGRLYIPLKGDRFDGHDFVAQAVTNGASAVLVGQWREEWNPLRARCSFVRVSDTLQGLQAFARWWRRKCGHRVLAVTGSNGKTSTKEFAFALLKDCVSVYASKASHNNHWGVPLSLLAAGPEHKYVVQEMGMNHSGELWRLCQIAEPFAVCVTTVGRAHIGELGSIEAVAQAKEEIYSASPGAVHVFNGDNEWTMRMQTRSQSKQIVFSSFKPAADVHLRAQRITWDGLDVIGHIRGEKGHTWVHVLGRQNTVNLMAASSLALAADVAPDRIWTGLGAIRDIGWGRNQILRLTNGARVLFDGYNANPDSMLALLKNLYEMESPGRKFLIAGDMLELGQFAEAAHEEIGERAGSVNFDGIWYVGQFRDAFTRGLKKTGLPPVFVASSGIDSEVSRQFFGRLGPEDLVAAKASRGTAIERAFKDWPLEKPLEPKP